MGNTIPVIPSQNFDADGCPCQDSKAGQKLETSKSMGHINNCAVNTAAKPTQKTTITHSNTFHLNKENSSNFFLNHLFNYPGRANKKKLQVQVFDAQQGASSQSGTSANPEKQLQRENKRTSTRNRDKKIINDQIFDQIDKRLPNHKKSLSCFNFNNTVSKPVNICAPSAVEYENANRSKPGKESSRKLDPEGDEKEPQEPRRSSVSQEEAKHSKRNERSRSASGIKQSQSSNAISRTVTITASTSELLKCLAIYLSIRCRKLANFHGNEVILWLRSIDRSLLVQGWQDIAFISPANVVFVYLLLRDYITDKVKNVDELQAIVLTCLYLSYSYVGNEISYPLKPFLVETDRRTFWSRCVGIINESSAKMLLINQDPAYFTHIFTELKQYGERTKHDNQ